MNLEIAVEKIKLIYSQYTPTDIASVLFVADLWPINMLSHVRHLLLATVLCSMSEDDFKYAKQVRTYKEFAELSKNLYAACPVFSMLEDYKPEPDYGDVKIQIGNDAYKFFFGSVGNMYDYLQEYIMFYSALNKVTGGELKRDPLIELSQILTAQNTIISSIKSPTIKKKYDKLYPGETSIAPESFWRQSQNFLNHAKWDEIMTSETVENFTQVDNKLAIGALSSDEKFAELVQSGGLPGACFLRFDNNLCPIMTRAWLEVLLNFWYEEIRDKLTDNV